MVDRKISEFNVSTSLNDSDLFTFVVNSTNKNISYSDFKLGLGITGTISAIGDPLGVPVLDIDSTDYRIRNFESSKGIIASVSAQDGVVLGCNFSQAATGSTIINNLNSNEYVFKTFIDGNGTTVDSDNESISYALNVSQNGVGVPIINDVSASIPVLSSLVAGSNVAITKTGDAITFSSSADPAISSSGFIDYSDLNTSTTPVSIPGTSTFTKLTNDGLGVYTEKSYAPVNVADLWNTSTNQFDFSGFELGDQVDVRLDMEITTTTAGQEADVEINFAIGGGAYTLPVTTVYKKTAGARGIAYTFSFYMGNNDTITLPAEVGVLSDSAATVKVNGWYIRVVKYHA